MNSVRQRTAALAQQKEPKTAKLRCGTQRAAISSSSCGRASDDERVVAENVAQHGRRIGRREVVYHDVADAGSGQFAGDAFGHLLRVAVHRAVGDDCARLAFVAAHAVVEVEDRGDFALPDGAVRRADRLGGQRTHLGERLLHRSAVFADDRGVVAPHLVPVAGGVELRVGDASVECAERAESVAREERLLLGTPGDHRLGPVDHRGHVEREGPAAQIERVALADLLRLGLDAVEAAEHVERLGVADDPHPGPDPAERGDRRRVVGLHMVDDEVVDLAVADFAPDVALQAVAERCLYGVDQGDPFARDQVGVVGDAARKGPEPFEEVGGAVVDADVADAGTYFRNAHCLSCLIRKQIYEKIPYPGNAFGLRCGAEKT